MKNNQQGVAIMLVLTSIVILMAIMGEFTFETNINKIKAYNIQEKIQARLNAEAGLQFAMARLKLYKEAFNYIENNESVKEMVRQETLNIVWNFPFIYPIPVTNEMNATQKEEVRKFTENSLLQGGMKLTIQNISNLMNLNLLRISFINKKLEEAEREEESNENTDQFNIANQLLQSFQIAMEEKREKDTDFFDTYANVQFDELIAILRFWMSDAESYQEDSLLSQARSDLDRQPLSPKHGPLSSFTELHMLPKWSDDLTELIRNEYTPHGAIMVDLNKLTDKMLRLLIPTISIDEMREFFEWRDDPEVPQFFNSLEDFKAYVVNRANLMNSADFDKKFSAYQKEGIQFGPAPTLFKVNAVGEFGRASYNLSAYVVIPARPAPLPQKNRPENDTIPPINPDEEDGREENDQPATVTGNEPEKQKTQLLEPRIIEIEIR
jgi:type II secretory pathway component PulK